MTECYYLRTLSIDIGCLLVMAVIIMKSQARICEPIKIAKCRSMPYDLTQMPNLLHHSTQINAELVFDQYKELLDTNCSEVLLFFLCSMFTPICSVQFRHESIPPCRDICERSRSGCEPFILRHNYTWPVNMDCGQFPIYQNGVCISPEAMQHAPIELPSYNCNCEELKVKSVRKSFMKLEFHYVLRARFRRVSNTRSADGSKVIKLHVIDVLLNGTKSHIRPMSSVSLLLHPEACLCPDLRHREEYLVMGFEEEVAGRNRLIFDSRRGTVAVPWKKNWPKNIRKWQKRKRKKRLRQDKDNIESNTV